MAAQADNLPWKAPNDDDSRACLEQSEKAQIELLGSFRHHKGFSDAEKDVVKLNNVQEFREYWGRLAMAQRNFDKNHEHGCGLFVRHYQTSASVVLAFMDEFSQLVNIVKDCIPGYGGMANATISLLFVQFKVARKKDGIERNLTTTIEAIRDRLPAIDLYKSIYDEKHALDREMQSMIIKTYQIFIEFCVSAIRYYMESGARRWLKALAPRNTHVEASAARVQSSITAIKRLGEELVAKNVDKIKRGNEDLDRKLLAVDMDQEGYEDVYELMKGAGLDQFVNSGVYRQWYTAELSSFLILSGCDNDGHNSPQCWLSPVALSTIYGFMKTNPATAHYAYYIIPHEGATVYQVLSSILLQLIYSEKGILRDESQRNAVKMKLYEYQQQMTSEESRYYGYNDKTDKLYDMAQLVIGFFKETDSVYIVIDRADFCCNFMDYDHLDALKIGLEKTIHAARCRLKILAIFKGCSWGEEKSGNGAEQLVIQRTLTQGLV